MSKWAILNLKKVQLILGVLQIRILYRNPKNRSKTSKSLLTYYKNLKTYEIAKKKVSIILELDSSLFTGLAFICRSSRVISVNHFSLDSKAWRGGMK